MKTYKLVLYPATVDDNDACCRGRYKQDGDIC